MWSPTHVQVIVQRAKGLLTKGKNKTNDCFVTIALGKEKYQTSVKEKALENVEWHEECELQIPQSGNTAEIVLTALHRNFLGVDEFLGTVSIPLVSFDIYEMPRNRWYELNGKPGKGNSKERGKLEIRIGFIVRAGSLSDLSKKERHKSSLGHISSKTSSFGGSLLSISSPNKHRGFKKLAKSISNKVKGKNENKYKLGDIYDAKEKEVRQRPKTTGQEHDADPGVISDEDEFTFDDLSHKSSTSSLNSSVAFNNSLTDSENIAQTMDKSDSSSHLSSGIFNSSQDHKLTNTPPLKPPRNAFNNSNLNLSFFKDPSKIQQTNNEDEWDLKLYGIPNVTGLKRREIKKQSLKNFVKDTNQTSPRSSPVITRLKCEINLPAALPQKEKNIDKINEDLEKHHKKEKREKEKNAEKYSSERIIIGGEESLNNININKIDSNEGLRELSRELLGQYEGKSREDLIELVLKLQMDIADQKKRLHDMEDYIDALLLKVIECSPRLLQNPWQPNRRLSSPGHQ